MIAEIITIGDEILIGQIVDTNSAWIGTQLNFIGIKVKQISSVSDDREHILKALQEAENRADLILVTGGLGPTKDDITKKTLAEYFGVGMIQHTETENMVRDFFAKRGRELTELNRKQAEVPENCEVLLNYQGTAPGMWFEVRNKIFVSMPGVPFEMKALMENLVLPKLKSKFSLSSIYHKTLLTNGIGESFLAEKIEDWENSLTAENLKLAYLPSPGMVRLRLSGIGKNSDELKTKIESAFERLIPQINEYFFGYEEYGKDPDSLEKIVAELLLKNNRTLALAESCTGGYISHLITSIAGSSAFYRGGIIPYHNAHKHELLGVDNSIFEKHGAVSEQCVLAMAKGVREKLYSDFAIAVSGIAGPTGGTDEKPVGLVWIAIATPTEIIAEKFQFGTDRGRNIRMTALAALNLLRKYIVMTL
jgi:nicotinamide-nucleotide amidase